MKKNTSHKDFAALLLRIQSEQAKVAVQLKTGEVNLASLAAHYGVPVTAIKSALDSLGIENGRALSAARREAEGGKLSDRVSRLETVVAMIARDLGATAALEVLRRA